MTPLQRRRSPQQNRATLKTLTDEIRARKSGIGRAVYEIDIRNERQR